MSLNKNEKKTWFFWFLNFNFASSNEHWITTIKININHQCLFRFVEFNSKITFCGLNSTLNKLQHKTFGYKFRKHRISCIFKCAILSENHKQTASKLVRLNVASNGFSSVEIKWTVERNSDEQKESRENASLGKQKERAKRERTERWKLSQPHLKQFKCN